MQQRRRLTSVRPRPLRGERKIRHVVYVHLQGENSTAKERIARRAKWQYPPGLKVLAEYWPQGSDIVVINVVESDNVGLLMAALSDWDDLMQITVVPAVTAEDGLKLAANMLK